MKESELISILSKLDTDSSMDKRIIEQHIKYGEGSDAYKCNSRLKALFRYMPRVALFAIIFSLFGTVTTMATIYYVKTYSVEFKTQKPTESHEDYYNDRDRTKEFFDTTDEMFAKLGLPNLTPTYLTENFKLNNNIYVEDKLDTGVTEKQLFMKFNAKTGQGRHIYIQYIPFESTTKDKGNTWLTDAEVTSSTYTTKSGLICNITTLSNDIHNVSVSINFDSKELGNAIYFLDFYDIEKDEMEAILDSIPITAETLD